MSYENHQSKIVDLIAIFTAKPGKAARLVELLSDLAKIVHQNEPGVLVYRITRGLVAEDGSQDIRMIEQFKDQDAFDHHSKTESLRNFVRSLQDEDVLAKPFELLFGNPAGGFVRTRNGHAQK